VVDTFGEPSDKVEVRNLEANPKETQAVVERQELFNKEVHFDNIGSLEDRCGERCLCGVAEGRKSGPKTVLGPGRSCLLQRKD
jgi:hypothetical protein